MAVLPVELHVHSQVASLAKGLAMFGILAERIALAEVGGRQHNCSLCENGSRAVDFNAAPWARMD